MISLRNTPWTNPSKGDQRTHAILHAIKAAGKLAAMLEAEAHDEDLVHEHWQDNRKYAADLVISAIRLADMCCFDLEEAVTIRQREKNK